MNKFYDLFYGDPKRKYIALLGALLGAHILCLPFFKELSDESYVALTLGVALLLLPLLAVFYSAVNANDFLKLKLQPFFSSSGDEEALTAALDKNSESDEGNDVKIKIANQKQGYRPRIFISHVWVDQPFGKLLADKLEVAGAKVVLGDIEKSGGNLPERINSRLHTSDFFLLVWSNAASESAEIKFEWEKARMLHKEIVLCPLDKTPLPPDFAKEHYINFNRFSNALDELKQILFLEGDLAAKKIVSSS